MNFSLKSSTKKGKKSNGSSTLGFGLNSRKKKKSFSALGDDSSSEEECQNNNSSSKDTVNRELAAEQAALRLRAEKALSEFSSTYDYDAEYDSFSSNKPKAKQQKVEDDGPKESRYIATLMEKAKERQQEREIIKERKIAKEQEIEDSNQDYLGKEKFVTSAYKRKLEERKAWLEKDEKRAKLEEEEDVTKRKGGGVMGFYSNFTNNVAVGGVRSEASNNEESREQELLSKTADGLEKQNLMNQKPNDYVNMATSNFNDDVESDEEMEATLKQQALAVKRLQKIFEARVRYFQRRSRDMYT